MNNRFEKKAEGLNFHLNISNSIELKERPIDQDSIQSSVIEDGISKSKSDVSIDICSKSANSK